MNYPAESYRVSMTQILSTSVSIIGEFILFYLIENNKSLNCATVGAKLQSFLSFKYIDILLTRAVGLLYKSCRIVLILIVNLTCGGTAGGELQ